MWCNSFVISLAELAALDSCFCSLQSPACLLGGRVCWGVTLQSPGDTALVHQCHWDPRARGKHKGPVWAGGICPWGPPLQEADPPTGPCSDESLMEKAQRLFLGKSTPSEKQENKNPSVCLLCGKSWARGKVNDLMFAGMVPYGFSMDLCLDKHIPLTIDLFSYECRGNYLTGQLLCNFPGWRRIISE